MNPAEHNPGSDRIRWHVTLDLVYEAGSDDSCEQGIKRVKSAIQPVIDSQSGIQAIYFMRLPEKI